MYPQDERPHTQLGNYLNGQQDFASAVEHYKHATAINPNFATAYNSLGYAYRSLEDLDSAKGAFAKYIELIPDEANPYDSYAELLMEMGDYDESIENYRKALAIDPNFAASYAGISINESLKGETKLAQEAADQMLAKARNLAERQGAMFRSVTSHLFAGNTDAAMEVCETMLAEAEVKRNHATMGGVSEYMGDIMLVAEEPAKAVEHFNAALDHRIQAQFNEANQAQAQRTHLFKTAIAAMIAEDLDSAATRAAEYSAAAEINGTAFEKRRIHELAAYLALNNDEFESAAQHFEQASQLNPIVLYWSAVTHAELGHTEKAIDLAARAANRNTLNGNLPFFREDAQELLAQLTAE
jgi:tetratricopeptide (TPR) repeat protein